MMDKKRCEISVEPHPVLGKIYKVHGDCGDRIKAINAVQGPYSQQAFNRRLVVDDSVESRANASKEE